MNHLAPFAWRSDMLKAMVMITVMFCAFTNVAQDADTAVPYEVPEAYEVYSALLPHERVYKRATDTLVIREDTDSLMIGENCMTSEQSTKFKDAIGELDKLQN